MYRNISAQKRLKLPVNRLGSRTLLAVACCLALSNCALRPTDLSVEGQVGTAELNARTPTEGVDSVKLASEGSKYLVQGNNAIASKLMNAAIKFDPENAYYHLLGGIAYHRLFIEGRSQDNQENAKVAYLVASRYAPASPWPFIQLGRLYSETGKKSESRDSFARALELKPGNPEALEGLVGASYALGDLKTALWGVGELEKGNWPIDKTSRARAVLFTAAGATNEASNQRALFIGTNSGTHPKQVQQLDQRLNQLQNLLDSQNWLEKPGSKTTSVPSDQNFQMAQATDQPVMAPGIDPAIPPSLPVIAPNIPGMPNPQAAMFLNSGPGTTTQDRKSKAWFECSPNSTGTTMGGAMMGGGVMGGGVMGGGMMGGGMMGGGMMGGGLTGPGGEETTALTAIPAPCLGDSPPKMAVIDAIMLRTEDEASTSHGVNLLQGLGGFFGRLRSDTNSNVVKTTFSGFGSAGSSVNSSNALMYSLNIANSTYNRNEVLARPSLLAIDRMPSTFFSGNTISIAVQGGSGGSGALVDKQVGVSFSIIPTIIDNDTVLLNIKAVRSFVTPPSLGTNGVALATSRNSVSANVTAKFGETIILSGLTERELIRQDSGVPVLKDIPGVQYMFAHSQTTDFFRTVMIMVTPRKPVISDEDIAAVENEKSARKITGKALRKKYAFYWRIEEYEKYLAKYAPNLDAAVETLQNNALYMNLKTLDLVDDNWGAKSKIQQILHEMKDLMWR